MTTPITTPLPDSLTDYIATRLDDTNRKRMEGWCTPEKADALARQVIAIRAITAIEIGVFAGRSLFAIALAQREVSPTARVLGIDPWSPAASIAGFETDPANRDWWMRLDHTAIYSQCVAVAAELGLTSAHLFRGTAHSALPAVRFAFPTPTLDLLHIDGNHSEGSALADVENYVPLVRPGGSVIFDDCDWETTKLAQQRLAKLCTLDRMVGACGFYTRNREPLR